MKCLKYVFASAHMIPTLESECIKSNAERQMTELPISPAKQSIVGQPRRASSASKELDAPPK